MKKYFYIAAVVSLAFGIGNSGSALAVENGDPQMSTSKWLQIAQQKNYNSSKRNTSTAVKKDNRDGDKNDTPKGSGDPMKGLLGGKGAPCKPCDVPFGGTVSGGSGQAGAAQAKGLNANRIRGKARPVTPSRR